MLDRRLVLALSLGASSLAAGCLLDAGPYASGGGGAGASINTGGLGGSGGVTTSTTETTSGGAGGVTTTSSTTSSTTTSSTTTTTSDPTCPGGCADSSPCTEDVCNNGNCSHPQLPAGTVVSSGDPNDCKQSICDAGGQVVEADADGETPLDQAGECFTWICQFGAPTKVGTNEGQPCNGVQPPPCKTNKCSNTFCQQTNVLNGDYPDPAAGECASVTCTNGSASSPKAEVSLCNLAPQNGGCRIAECGPTGGGLACYLVDAPNNDPCTKGDGTAGMCDNSGNCD